MAALNAKDEDDNTTTVANQNQYTYSNYSNSNMVNGRDISDLRGASQAQAQGASVFNGYGDSAFSNAARASQLQHQLIIPHALSRQTTPTLPSSTGAGDSSSKSGTQNGSMS